MIKKETGKSNLRIYIFSIIAIIILIVVIIDKLSFNPLLNTSNDVDEELSLKNELLVKYQFLVSKKDSYQKKLDELKDSYTSFEKKLFLCKTEDLAQAKLQQFVKNIARKSGIVVSRCSSKKGEIINSDPQLFLIHANFEIKDIDKIRKLQTFLYNIEHDKEKLILIEDLKIKSTGFGTVKGVSMSIKLFTIARLQAKA